jgi:hypothetical protein
MPSLRFHRTPIGSADEKRFCHAAAATHGVNEIAGIRRLRLIVAAHRRTMVGGTMMIKLPRISMGASRIETRAHEVPDGPRTVPAADTPDNRPARSGSAEGRRLRNWLIAGNIAGWALIFLAARAIFS